MSAQRTGADDGRRGEIFDFAFAGGGVAGLALACALAESEILGARLLVIDDASDILDDRTLSYFADRPLAIDHLARHVFARVRFVAPGLCLELPMASYRYRSVRACDFRRDAHARLARHRGVTVVSGQVDRIDDGGDHASVVVDGKPVLARWVFDSRRVAAAPAMKRHDALVQRFIGWEIELDEPLLDPSAATLFHFLDDAAADRFHYVLPFSARRGLFEVVTFGAPVRESDLEAYVAQVMPGVGFRILRREGGSSLLSTAPFVRNRGRRVVVIGVAGGLLKPSTGYALTRILDDTAAIVASLEEGRHPLARRRQSSLYRSFDAVFLRLAATRPSRLPGVFRALFTGNPIERILRFLDERASLRDLVGIVWSMPKVLFLRALLGWVAVRLGLISPVQRLRHDEKTAAPLAAQR